MHMQFEKIETKPVPKALAEHKCQADFYALWCDECHCHPSSCKLAAPSLDPSLERFACKDCHWFESRLVLCCAPELRNWSDLNGFSFSDAASNRREPTKCGPSARLWQAKKVRDWTPLIPLAPLGVALLWIVTLVILWRLRG
jgi:hypothetical protein